MLTTFTHGPSRPDGERPTHGVDDGRAGLARPDVGEALGLRGAVVSAPAAVERVARRHAVRTLLVHLARLDRNLRHLTKQEQTSSSQGHTGGLACGIVISGSSVFGSLKEIWNEKRSNS